MRPRQRAICQPIPTKPHRPGGTRPFRGLFPKASLVTAGRLHVIEQYPKIMQVLRELSGQGLIYRDPETTWVRSDVSAMLNEFLPGHNRLARAPFAVVPLVSLQMKYHIY